MPKFSKPPSKKQPSKKQPSKKLYKKLFGLGIKFINFSLKELKEIARHRKDKDYKNKSEDELIRIISKTKPKINFLD